MLHLFLGVFRGSNTTWDAFRGSLPVSLDGRLVHPVDHYVINANPKAPNPPCPIQLTGMNRVGIMAKAAPGREQRHSEPTWQGRDRSQWFGSQLLWPPQSAPVPWCVRQGRTEEGTRNTCLLCHEPGHNYRACLWYWAWLLTQENQHRETLESLPTGIRDLLAQHLDIMQQGQDLDIPEQQVIAIGIGILAGHNTMEALRRQAERLERSALAEELGHPLNWQTTDMDELRAMADNHRRNRNRAQRPKPKAQPATGAHSTQNFQLNQALLGQIQNQDDQSDQSAVAHRDDDEVDYSDDKNRTY